MEINQLYRIYTASAGVCTDTRKINVNCLFVALKGDRFDANTFAEQAISLGASHVLIDNPAYYKDERTILVEDTLTALQQLAIYHRTVLDIPIIALTGSNGKTTTKELINVVLSRKYIVGATVGNLNNHIGVPLTLLSFNPQTQIGIVEMGANHQKEIAFLCEIAKPDYGYITNFGKAHLEGFGGFEGVIKGKSEMYHYLRKANKTAIVNLDDPLQVQHSNGLATIPFGSDSNESTVALSDIGADPLVRMKYDGQVVQSQLIGIYNAANISAAITIGNYFGVTANEAISAIESYVPDNNRSQLTSAGTNKVILDAYNANPSSMKAALANFIQLPADNKIAFLGDMFELGPESETEHAAVIDSIAGQPHIQWHFIGKDFSKAKSGESNVHFHKTFEDIQTFLESNKIEDSTILIKGSRGMSLERILSLLS